MGLDAMIFIFWMLSFKPTFSLSTFTFIKRLLSILIHIIIFTYYIRLSKYYIINILINNYSEYCGFIWGLHSNLSPGAMELLRGKSSSKLPPSCFCCLKKLTINLVWDSAWSSFPVSLFAPWQLTEIPEEIFWQKVGGPEILAILKRPHNHKNRNKINAVFCLFVCLI